MSYYSNINFDNQSNQSKQKIHYKDKFFVNENPNQNNPGYYTFNSVKSDVIDTESLLLKSTINSKDKVQLKLKNEFNPSDYSLFYTNNTNNKEKQDEFYYNNKDISAGRGFGNLNISNEIRYGSASRNNTKELKEQQETKQLFDFQFQYLDKNFQDPSHIVMNLPRGGDSTRKQNQLSVDTMRSVNSYDSSDELLQTIKFNY